MNVFWINEFCHLNLWVIISINIVEMRLMNYWYIYDWINIFFDGNMFNYVVFINCKILEELIYNLGKIVIFFICVIWLGIYFVIYMYLIEYVEYFSDN